MVKLKRLTVFKFNTFYFILSMLLFLVLAFASFVTWSWKDVIEDQQHSQEYTVQMLEQTTSAILVTNESLLATIGYHLISMSADIDPEKGREYIDSMQQINPVMTGFGLARIDGQLVLISNVKQTSGLPNLLEKAVTAQSFRTALEKDNLVVGRTYYHPQIQQWVMPVRTPIKDDTGLITGVMTSGYILSVESLGWSNVKLSTGAELRLLRGDGYWQYLRGVEQGQLEQTYTSPISANLFNHISALAKGRVKSKIHTLNGEEWLLSARYIAKYDLYALSMQPIKNLHSLWWQRIKYAVLLMFSVLVISFWGLGFAWKIQQSFAREKKKTQLKLFKRANFSSVTQLPNRSYIQDLLAEQLKLADADGGEVVVAIVDIDNFQDINSTFGHAIADRTLAKVARNLTRLAGAKAAVGHMGGDEFSIIWHNASESFETFLQHVKALNPTYLHINRQLIHLSSSIGVARYPIQCDEPAKLFNSAGLALASAKRIGLGRVEEYNQQLAEERERWLAVKQQLRSVVNGDEFSVYYQPKYRIGASVPYGFEALLRWYSPELGLVSPSEFILVAEKTGVIDRITQFVLKKALADLMDIRRETRLPLTMSINVSVHDVMQKNLASRVKAVLTLYDIPPSALELELTENVLAENMNVVRTELSKLRALGVTVAIDDFGTGYSSLSYLSQIACDRLKIDRTFIANLGKSHQDEAITKSVIALGKSLQLKVIAEGVETDTQLKFLSQLDCDEIQGYLKCRPLPLKGLYDLFNELQAYEIETE